MTRVTVYGTFYHRNLNDEDNHKEIRQVVRAIEEETGRKCIPTTFEDGTVEYTLHQYLTDTEGYVVQPAPIH